MGKNIYEKIFSISEANMKNAGGSFTHSKAAFLAYTNADPHKADLIELFNVKATNPEFLDIAYITLLNRPVETESFNNWKKHFSMPQKEFRRVVINDILNSKEADICHKRIYNDIFTTHKKHRKESLRKKTINTLMPIYRKLPEKIKSPIRKIAGGNQE